jgi:hypothetical protein
MRVPLQAHTQPRYVTWREVPITNEATGALPRVYFLEFLDAKRDGLTSNAR